MRFLKLSIILSFLVFSISSFGIPVKRQSRDMKLVTQKLIEYQSISDVLTSSAAGVLLDEDGPSSGSSASITSFLAQPDVTRNLTITPTSTTADVASCVINIVGTDFHGQSINEDFTFIANQSTIEIGSKAFKTVISVDFPASCEDSPYGATWRVGYEERIGLKRCMDQDGWVVMSTAAGAKETGTTTATSDASNIEGNTFDFAGTMNGSNDFEVFFFQNFAQSCFP